MTTLSPSGVIENDVSAYLAFTIEQNVDWNDALEVTLDPVDFPNGLADCVVETVVRRSYGSDDLIHRASTATGDIFILGFGRNVVQWFTPAWRTGTFPAGSFVHMTRILKGPEVRGLARGPFIVKAAEY